ncbi:hypothetical protein ALC60_00604, partial [Trachymyrmex zeteki]
KKFYSILTLCSAEIGEVPDEFADKKALASQSIESFETGHSICSVFGHKYRLVIFSMPSLSFPLNSISNHVQSTGIAIPGVITIEADHVEKLTCFVFLKFTISIYHILHVTSDKIYL